MSHAPPAPAAAALLRAFGTLREMLRDRGVAGSAEDLEAVSSADLVALSAKDQVFHLDLPACRHRLVFNLAPRFRLQDVRRGIEAPEEAVDVVVLVVREEPTTTARKSIDELQKAQRTIQVFSLQELQFNVTHHELVPRHEAVRDEAEVRDILRTYQVRTRQFLPLILSTDPVARYLGLRPGQLVRITRPSPSCGEYESYRCCARP